MSESSARPPRAEGPTEPYDPYRDPIAGSGEHVARGGAPDPLDTSVPYEPGLSGFGGTGRDAGSSQGGSGGGTGQQAKQQASRVADDAKASGAHVRDVAGDQAAGVAQEAKSQAKGLLETTRSEVSQQASHQTRRAASGLSSFGEQLQSLVSGDPQPGPASDLARQAADRVSGAARWMEGREPADLLEDVQRFARRRPGAFLAIAAGVGLVAGRLTRGVAADAKEHREDASTGTAAGTGPARTGDATDGRDVLGGRGDVDPGTAW